MANFDPILPAVFALLSSAVAAWIAMGSLFRAYREQKRGDARYKRDLTDFMAQEMQNVLGQEAGDEEESRRRVVPEAEIRLLSARLDRLEEKFPDGAALEKYVSVNDAILATRHEDLVRRMDRLESEAMTPGKVILLLSTVLAVLFSMMAALPFILQQLGA